LLAEGVIRLALLPLQQLLEGILDAPHPGATRIFGTSRVGVGIYREHGLAAVAKGSLQILDQGVEFVHGLEKGRRWGSSVAKIRLMESEGSGPS
jgi:hypothetical protein